MKRRKARKPFRIEPTQNTVESRTFTLVLILLLYTLMILPLYTFTLFVMIALCLGQPLTSFLLAPAVTPWQTTLPGVMGGTGNNPCIRLVSYDRRTGHVVDVEQHFLELDKANKEPATDTWQLEYRFTEYFRVPDVSTSSLNDLAERFIVKPAEFSLYYEINDAKFPLNRTTWNETMRSVHYCAITRLDYIEYDTCIKERENQANDAMAHSMAIINSVVFGGLAFLIANL